MKKDFKQWSEENKWCVDTERLFKKQEKVPVLTEIKKAITKLFL